jgi:serine/threonine protein kinase
MGVVFQAEDTELLRPVALKVIKPERAGDAAARQRFLQEARGPAAVAHDHIVTIFRVGEDRGVPYLAMQLLQGETLQARLRRDGPLPAAEVLRIGRQIAEGLAGAHERGLIHRDIKPANIWLEAPGGRVKILDFGLVRMAQTLGPSESPAKVADAGAENDGRLTQEGAVLGTPAYMAPEQADGQEVDARADLFSLGCVLYALCTGQRAFSGTGLSSTLAAVRHHQPLPPRQVNPRVPPGLSALVMRLLAKRADDRPSSAREVAEALAAIERDLSRPRGPRALWPVLAGLGVLVVLGVWGPRVLSPDHPPASTAGETSPAVQAPLPPRVSLQLVEQKGDAVKVRVTAAAADKSQRVTALRLLLNGKPVPGKVWQDFDRGQEEVELEWALDLPLEAVYQLVVQARGWDVSATSDVLTVKYGGNPAMVAEAPPPNGVPRVSLKLLEQKGGQVKVKATAIATAKEQPVTEWRLLLDGRSLPNREGVIQLDKGREQAEAEWTVMVPNGLHELKALARCPDVAGVSEALQVKFDDPAQRPVLHLLAIGVDDYLQKGLKLGFAVNDARELAQAFQDHARGVFQKVEATVITDQQATRPNISEWLTGIGKKTKPGDLVVVFFSGHGVVQRGEFYLLTREADPSKPLAGNSLSTADLRVPLGNCPCNVLLLLDAPHSGAAAKALADDEGAVVVMAAATGHEMALEDSKLKHGRFTLALIEGLSGKARASKGGVLSLHHLYSYVLDRVGDLSEGKQHPFLAVPWTVGPFPLAKP